MNFSPAISDKATQKIKDAIRACIRIVKPTDTLKELAREINPAVIGWENYYGKFNNSELLGLWWLLDTTIIGWAKKKYGEKLSRGMKKGK